MGQNDSVLVSIKKLLGLASDYHEFDGDIIIHINSVFSILQQLGVGPAEGFSITSEQETWANFIDDNKKVNDVITYVYLKVRQYFDPPTNSSILNAQQELIRELEWRLNVAVDNGSNT